MSNLLQVFIWLPFLGFIISALLPRKSEKLISMLAITITGFCLIGITLFILVWLMNAGLQLNIKHIVLFKENDIEIFIDFFFDKITAVFVFVGALLTFAVAIFSRYYLHREEGFKRYFSILLLFYMGYNLVVLSGNFETFFIGWELVGICSFLLIAFYRDRYLPVRNSLKVISIYRLSDIFLILAMWMSHHLWNENITFLQLNDTQLVIDHITTHNWFAFFIALMIVFAATVKSAQMPFSTWLPRAMEGPTTSSAIFYGSLSVHLGVFLLLRTYPYWNSILAIKIILIVIGLLSSLMAANTARVQSTVKTQIAYSSIAQIGIIFIEIALGLHWLALIHFMGNAFLRTYQLLVSPSVMSYRIHEMFFSFSPKKQDATSAILAKFKNTLYIYSLKEWNLDLLLQQLLWNPFKKLGKRLNFLSKTASIIFLVVLFVFGIYSAAFQEQLHVEVVEYLPHLFSLLGLLFIIKAFTEKGDARIAWTFIILAQLFIALSIALLNENFGQNHILLYLSGTLISALFGLVSLYQLKKLENDIQLNKFHGNVYEHPKISFIFLICCLGMIGLPFTPTFIGIDILFNNIHKHEEILIVFTSLSFMILEIAILRIYARLFLGQHKKAYHPIAYRSS